MEENTEGKKTIMLVDDDKFLLDMYSIKFGQSNFNVLASLGSDDALKKLHEGAKPDLILFDMAMPGIDGDGIPRDGAERKSGPSSTQDCTFKSERTI
jgi:CheY-like chemotaxis protein